MLSSNFLRSVRPHRVLFHSTCQVENRAAAFKSVCCPVNSSFLKKDIGPRALEKDSERICYINMVRSVRNFCVGTIKLDCWNCKKALDKTPAFFCWSCKIVQPPEEGTSFFTIMDCDQTFGLDTHKLQRRYLELQRSLHPDNFSQKSVTEQEYSVRQSALVNKAYQTLLKPLSRGLYMLELRGMRIEDGTDAGANPEFLMELMEINESLDEAQTPEEADKIGRDTKGLKGSPQPIVFLQRGNWQA